MKGKKDKIEISTKNYKKKGGDKMVHKIIMAIFVAIGGFGFGVMISLYPDPEATASLGNCIPGILNALGGILAFAIGIKANSI